MQAPVDELPAYAVPPRHPTLKGLPSALTLVAHNDPLRFEGMLYSEQLRAAGVMSEFCEYDDCVHGFLNEPAAAGNQVARALSDVLDWALRLAIDVTVSGSPTLEA